METSSEEEDFYTSSSESVRSEAVDSILIPGNASTNEALPLEAENMDVHILFDEVPLDLTTRNSRAASLANLASARAASNSADEHATTQPQSGARNTSSYVQYLVDKFSNYSVVTMNCVEFEINKVLFRADMGTYESAP
ncbi:uncharacterized protein LOC111077741 isoform X2 [Drosophila obscura]|nr:uncharacterized protein LOC111077741 isoform X2 [Drosophila obscura]